MEKILFLDVDGVLNNDDWAWTMWEDYKIKVYNNNILYQPSLVQLKRIHNATQCKIVLSSSWRRFPKAREDLVHWLSMYDLVIDSDTPKLRQSRPRGDAITAWFKKYPGEYRYVILDDEDDMGEHYDHLVRTNYFAGLTEEEANKCIDILNLNERNKEHMTDE